MKYHPQMYKKLYTKKNMSTWICTDDRLLFINHNDDIRSKLRGIKPKANKINIKLKGESYENNIM
jgi:hypothetical protein